MDLSKKYYKYLIHNRGKVDPLNEKISTITFIYVILSTVYLAVSYIDFAKY